MDLEKGIEGLRPQGRTEPGWGWGGAKTVLFK